MEVIERTRIPDNAVNAYKAWQRNWGKFAKDVLCVTLDPEQRAILSAVQHEKMVAVASGTARGKDFVAAVAALCFMYLTPKFNSKNELIENTKVALTAPTGRQVGNIMYPEITRLFHTAKVLPGRLVGTDIRTEWNEWFLTGFKADEHNQEAWSGFHAVNTMFIVTEASGISESIFAAIEGNLQSNSKILIVFNPNTSIGYAARAMNSPRWKSFRLDDLTAPNVIQKRNVIPGQVDYEWVKDKVATWCEIIQETDFNEGKGDFEFEDVWYRPNDLFRVKVRGMFPEVSEDVLIPDYWIELAVQRWKDHIRGNRTPDEKLGVDVAGMGRDSSIICHRSNEYVSKFDAFQSGGKADHMQLAGVVKNLLAGKVDAFIDTIGEGAGVYSRLVEQGLQNKVYSCKFSENANGLHDVTGQYEFINMRAYLFWAVRDWLNPANKSEACLPDLPALRQELVEIKYIVQSNGKIIIEKKEEIKKRLGRSTDYADALANTFYPTKQAGMKITDLSELLP